VLFYRDGAESDPFGYIFRSPEWLERYDPPRSFPFWLNVEPTNVCNLDCLFCSRQLSARPLGRLSPTLAEAIFDEAAAHPGAAVRFTGWGEPLLHPEIGRLAALAKTKGLGLKIYTNGLTLTAELMDLFVELEVDDLQFSLQGLTPAQYERNRVGADFARLESRVALAAERRGRRKRPFLSLLTSALARELEEADANAFAARWLKLVDKVAVDLTNLNFVAGLDRVRPLLGEQSSGLRRGRCVDVFLALEIKYDGTIQFCGQDSQDRPEHTIGRFGEMSLAQAWRSPRMEAQRELVGRALGHQASPVCRACFHNTDKYDFFKKQASLPIGEPAVSAADAS
jgi:organic radical activating enzyme